MKRLKALGLLGLLLLLFTQLYAVTPVFITGFEQGIISANGEGLWWTIVGAPSVQASVKRTGGYALLCGHASEAQEVMQYASGSAYLVGCFFFRMAALPAATRWVSYYEHGGDYVNYKFSVDSSGVLIAQVGVGAAVNGPTLAANTWYRLDFRLYGGSTSGTIEWAVDGAAKTTATGTVTADTFNFFALGDPYNAWGTSLYFDDVVISKTSTDYPIGAQTVVGLRPNADATHNNAGDIMELSDGSDIKNVDGGAAVLAWDVLEENPWVTTADADYVRQTADGAANYAAINFADTTGATIHGVMAYMQYASATATANDGEFRIRDAAAQETVIYNGDMSEVTAFYKSAIVTPPVAGWTTANVNSLIGRFGYSGDADPDPYWLGIMLEVSYTGEVPTTYYVDSAITDTNVASATPDFTTYNHLTFETTGGSDWAYKTIADVNVKAFSAGDFIYFRKGQTWREQLTVPSSGTTGLPITFGAYGTGDDPIISGADLVTTWVNTGTEIDDNFDDNDITDWTNLGGANCIATGGVFQATVANAATRAAYKTGTVRTEYWASARVKENLTLTNNDDRCLSVFGITKTTQHNAVVGVWRKSGAHVFLCTYYNDAGQQFDTATTACTAGDWYNIIIHWKAATAPGANNGIFAVWINGVAHLNLTNVDSDTLTCDSVYVGDRWGTNCSGTVQVDDVKFGVYVSDLNLWRATLAGATVTNYVCVNGTRGAVKTSAPLCEAANNWYHDTTNNILYLYSTTDPDTKTVGAAQRASAINVNGKNYITISDLSIEMGNAWPGGDVSNSTSNVTGLTVQDCTLKNGYAGVYCYNGTASGILISGNTVTGNDWGISFGQYNSGLGTESTISENTISGNYYDGINVRGNYYIIEHNTVYDNGLSGGNYNGIHTYSGGVGEGTGDNNIIRYNIVYNQMGAVHDGSGIIADQWCDNNEIYYNICYNNQGYGIAAYDAANVSIYNNVCYGNCLNAATLSEPGEIRLLGSASDLTTGVVKNNIGFAVTSGAYAISIDSGTYNNDITITNNCWYRASGNWYFWNATGGATLATWNALTGVGTDLNSDPSMTTPTSQVFTLLPASPCINAGTDVSLTEDYAGSVVPQMGAVDIGAYESPYGYIPRVILIK